MPLDNVTTQLSMSEALLHYSLFVAMFALAAGFVFFLAEKEKIIPAYRATMTTSAIICGVAAVAYYYLTRGYSPNVPFPTDVRYVDWTVTTPLLLIKYPEMLKVRGFGFALKLVIADVFMIVTGFIGELYGTSVHGHWQAHDGTYLWGVDAVGAHYFWGLVSTLGYLYIGYVLLFGEGKRLAALQPPHIRRGIQVMNRYIWSLWGIYPIVFILEGVSAHNTNFSLNGWQIASAVGDVINKVGFGLTAYFAVKALSGDSQYSDERLPTSTDTEAPAPPIGSEGSARTPVGGRA